MSVSHTMQDEAAIRQLVRDVEAAWNDRDGYAYARAFKADAEYRVLWGFKIQGQAAIAQSHQEIFDNQYRHSRLEMAIEAIRFLRADVAYVETVNRLHNVELPFEKSIAAIVMTKENGEWRAVTFNNAGILPMQEGQS